MINNLYHKSFFSHKRDRVSLLILFVLLMLAFNARAQEGSQGNTSIFGGAQMSFFGNYNFLTGGSGAQPGVILTERATNNFGILNFVGDNLSITGASDVGYVDGYVRKYGIGQFIFPVGDNNQLGQFAASADGTMGAYFFANPSTAITSNLFTGSDYTVPLPVGGPFATANRSLNVGPVSTIEYWDIDGANATPITLTWDLGSGISTLTQNDLTSLTIVGWNSGTSKWERIPSEVDATSIFGAASAPVAGSITSTGSVIPNTYTAYTFAQVILPDLTPAQFFSDTQLSIGETVDYVVAISNVGPETTAGPIVFTVTNYGAATGITITPNATATATIDGDVFPLNNAEFTMVTGTTRFTFTSNTNVAIPSLGVKYFGFKITRSGGVNGTTNNTVTITNGTGGGETPTNNNTIANPITKI